MCIFTVTPVFVSTTDFNEDGIDINFARIADLDAYSMYCSYIPPLSTTIAVSCSVNGIPTPNVSIYREGRSRPFPVTFQQGGNIVVGVPQLKPKEYILLHCVASNIVSTVRITTNLTYTCK